jgi:hypothetical protein
MRTNRAMNEPATARSDGACETAVRASASATWLFAIGQTRPFHGHTWRFPFQCACESNRGSSTEDDGTG